jgi:hypothetical protein
MQRKIETESPISSTETGGSVSPTAGHLPTCVDTVASGGRLNHHFCPNEISVGCTLAKWVFPH